jgi:site-specific DNA-methyltransferase (adenine-specific)
MTFPEQQGCGRKIKSNAAFAESIKQILESVVRYKKPGKPLPGDVTLEVEIPSDMLENAELLLAAGKFDIEYPCCTIVNHDCRPHLINFAAGCFDLIVTDPPYGKNFKPCQEHHGKTNWDSRFPTELVCRVSAEDFVFGGGSLVRLGSYVFCEWENLWNHERRVDVVAPGGRGTFTLDKPKSVLVWHKIGGGGMGDTATEHIRDYEMALFYPGPEHKFKKRPPCVLKHRALGNNAHPTQKPLSLIKQILGWYDFETVFDPFMGSGTTAVAAKQLGKHFFGFEANKKYFGRAVRRLAEIGK